MKLIFCNPPIHLVIGLIGLAVVLFGSVTSSPLPDTELLPDSDKVIHALAYGGLCLWFAQLMKPKHYLYLGLALFFYGALIEWIQGQLPHRSASGLDLLANLLGIATAICICLTMVKVSSKNLVE